MVLTTAHTVTAFVEYSAACRYAGHTQVTLAPMQGNAFSFPAEAPWSGTITGTVDPAGVTVRVQATANFDGVACDTGPLEIRADQRGS